MTTNINAIVAAKVLALVAAGSCPVEALRTVCGTELVDQMIGEVYDALRARR